MNHNGQMGPEEGSADATALAYAEIAGSGGTLEGSRVKRARTKGKLK